MEKSKKIFFLVALIIIVAGLIAIALVNPTITSVPSKDAPILLNIVKVVLFIALLAAIFFTYVIIYKDWKIHNLFLCMILVFGLLFMFVLTPLSGPDEAHHYQSTYVFSNMLLGKENINLGSSADFDYSGLGDQTNPASAYIRIVEDIFKERVEGVEQNVPGPYGLSYLGKYIIPVLGLTLGRLLGLNMLLSYGLGRLFQLVAFAFCVWGGIKLAPKFKMLLGFVALLPMTMQQATQFSYDNIIISFCFLGYGAMLHAIFTEGKFTFKEWLLIALPLGIQGPVKAIYAFGILCMLFIPAARFKNKFRKWLVCLPTVLVVLAIAAWGYFKIPSIAGASGAGSSYYHQAFYTYGWIFSNVGDALKVLFGSLVHYGPKWIAQMLGANLSGFTVHVNRIVVAIMGLLCFGALESNNCNAEGCKLSGGFRTVSILVFIIAALASIIIMFTSYTPFGAAYIEGVQGRYFLPALPLALIGLYVKKFEFKKDISKYLLLAETACVALVIVSIVIQTVFC